MEQGKVLKKTALVEATQRGIFGLNLNEDHRKEEKNHGKIWENGVWGRGNNQFKGPATWIGLLHSENQQSRVAGMETVKGRDNYKLN